MLKVYDRIMRLVRWFAMAIAPDESQPVTGETMRFLQGQRHAVEAITDAAARLDRNRPTVWFHAASLREYCIARPVISQLRRSLDCNILVTLISTTAYETVSRSDKDIDGVFYLPFDTADNAAAVINAVRPDCAVFMVDEFKHNYLHLLKERGIPSLLVSAVIRDDGPFFHPIYGRLYRHSLGCFTHIFTSEANSIATLKRLGLDNGVETGDPLFDNASLMASTEWSDPVVERFKGRDRIFLAGSIHDDEDLEMITELANRHPSTRFIIVPHEINERLLHAIELRVKGSCLRRSLCDDTTQLDGVQVLVIDSVGSLAYLYRYAGWAYVGGGFSHQLHSVVEAAVYGIPVAFGPAMRRSVTPQEMTHLGIGQKVEDVDDLDLWFKGLKGNENRMKYVAKRAAGYVKHNTGATTRVVDEISRYISNYSHYPDGDTQTRVWRSDDTPA